MTRPRRAKSRARPAPVVLLAQNEAGYLNLMKLNSCLYIDKGGQLPQVTLEELERHAAGLICLTGGPMGRWGGYLQTGQGPKARALMQRLAASLSGPALCRIAAPSRRGRAADRGRGRDRARLCRDWPMTWACRWWPPMMSISPRPRCMRRMTR